MCFLIIFLEYVNDSSDSVDVKRVILKVLNLHFRHLDSVLVLFSSTTPYAVYMISMHKCTLNILINFLMSPHAW